MKSGPGAEEVQLGLNMDPKWLQGRPPEAFLAPLRRIGLRVLEFRLDLTAPGWKQVDRLIRACRTFGFRVTFHAPHKGPFNPTHLSGAEREGTRRLLEPVIDYAASVAREDGPTILVVHGAKGDESRESLRRDTHALLSWIGKRSRGIHLALELRIRQPDVIKIGDTKAELLSIVSQSPVPQLGICWDLGHDARNGSAAAPPGFIERVTHVHVHDLSPHGEDHHPLLFENAPYREALRRLSTIGYRGALVLEVDGHAVGRIARDRGLAPEKILAQSFNRIREAF